MMRRILCLLMIAITCTAHCTEFCVMYHGSSHDFEKVQPRYEVKENWKGVAIFGSFDYRIGLFYTHNKHTKYKAEIDLATKHQSHTPIIYQIKGGKSFEEALIGLWGAVNDEPKGYIYLLDGRKFIKEEGLGVMEKITRDVDANIGKVRVHRRREIQSLIAQGLVEIKWQPN